MASLAKVVHQFCSDQAGAAYDHDLHVLIYMCLFLQGFGFL
jgi:hypothetical protein